LAQETAQGQSSIWCNDSRYHRLRPPVHIRGDDYLHGTLRRPEIKGSGRNLCGGSRDIALGPIRERGRCIGGLAR